MTLTSALKTLVSWLVGVVVLATCAVLMTMGFMLVVKVPMAQFGNLLVLAVTSTVCGGTVVSWAKSAAAWLREVMGVK